MKGNRQGTKLVYTSDPEEARRLREESASVAASDEPSASQTIRVAIDRKRGRGRPVTVASGFRLTSASLDRLATELKKRCGAGGSSSDGEIVIQGEKLDLVAELLEGKGFRLRR